MFTKIKTLIFIIVMLCACNMQPHTYSVNEINKISSRDVSELNTFRIKGIIRNSIKVSFLNAFCLSDVNDINNRIFIFSHEETVPGNEGQLVILRIRFYQEWSLGNARFILFEEVNSQ